MGTIGNGSRRRSYAISSNARETWVKVNLLSKERYFAWLGVTDTGIVRVKRRQPVVVTDDGALTRQLEHERRQVVNFTRIRSFEA